MSAFSDDPSFWALVDRSGECWQWMGHRDSKGYGRLSRKRLSTSPFLAHRYSWLLAHGSLPSTVLVCHHCDNPPCVRPDHLFAGTQTDNMRDMSAKGRGAGLLHPIGLAHPLAWIPDDVVREARESYAQGRETKKEIAARLGTSGSTVGAWIRGGVRLEAGGPITTPITRRKRERAA